ncbi:hypothetical protein V8E53_015327 [Lactarius tabidus]
MNLEKNVFFFSHDNPENSEDDLVLKRVFEVSMIRDLVSYFLKQGPYDGAGDIAILCAYLGQLQQVHAALNDLKIAVSVDERDEEQLERAGLAVDDEIGFPQAEAARHLRGYYRRLPTVHGSHDIKDPDRNGRHLPRPRGQDRDHLFGSKFQHIRGRPIGLDWFLKSPNSINFALSRAQHGLYIRGNASNIGMNETWRTDFDEIDKEEQLGYGFPIICPCHSNAKQMVSALWQIPLHAPEGGC